MVTTISAAVHCFLEASSVVCQEEEPRDYAESSDAAQVHTHGVQQDTTMTADGSQDTAAGPVQGAKLCAAVSTLHGREKGKQLEVHVDYQLSSMQLVHTCCEVDAIRSLLYECKAGSRAHHYVKMML